jgi:hypothetical protein
MGRVGTGRAAAGSQKRQEQVKEWSLYSRGEIGQRGVAKEGRSEAVENAGKKPKEG